MEGDVFLLKESTRNHCDQSMNVMIILIRRCRPIEKEIGGCINRIVAFENH